MATSSKSYDIVVIGGGIAGIAAAVQASRCGYKTALIEKTVLLGGLATSGLVYIYLPLCDGNGTQVSYGLCEELIKLCNIYGPGAIPANWREARNAKEPERYRTTFSPASYMLALDELVVKEKVDLWLDTLVTDAKLRLGNISAITVENESGTIEIKAKRFIDASGSAILARRLQMPVIHTDNYRSIWNYEFDHGKMQMHFGPVAIGNLMPGYSDEVLKKAGYTKNSLIKATIQGISGKIVTDYILKTHDCIREYYRDCYENKGESREEHFPVKLPIMTQLRQICAIDAVTPMTDGQDWMNVTDSVGLVADWRRPGSVWEVPYSSLYAKTGPANLLFAGRCMGAIGDAWDVMRVIPCAAVTGQAAGLAAALSLRKKTQPNKLEYSALEKELRTLQIPLHFPELGLKKPKK